MRFLADENFSAKLASWLRSLGHDVKSAAKSTPDRDIVAQASVEFRIILTHDADFADEELYPAFSHAGIILIRINPLDANAIRSALSKILAKIPEPAWKGKLMFVFEDGCFDWKSGRFLPMF